MTNAKLIEMLSQASSLELYELSATIDRLLTDPRRIGAVMARLNLGKTVYFVDPHTGQMLPGKVVALKGQQVTVEAAAGSRTRWKLSYAAIDPGDANERMESAQSATQPPPPISRPGPEDFRRGDKVSFTDKYLQPQLGIISRINQRTASVECEGGNGWRVPFEMLRRVVDV